MPVCVAVAMYLIEKEIIGSARYGFTIDVTRTSVGILCLFRRFAARLNLVLGIYSHAERSFENGLLSERYKREQSYQRLNCQHDSITQSNNIEHQDEKQIRGSGSSQWETTQHGT
jgi:hypothetical protein